MTYLALDETYFTQVGVTLNFEFEFGHYFPYLERKVGAKVVIWNEFSTRWFEGGKVEVDKWLESRGTERDLCR